MSDALCQLFQRLAIRVSMLVSAGRRARVRAEEETITNLLLIKLRLRAGPKVVVHAYTRPREAEIGADWEMWLGRGSGQWLGLRLQAKAVDSDGAGYSRLHYRSKSGSYQSDTLITSALTQIPPRVPLYLLYSNLRQEVNQTQWPCANYRADDRLYGCSLLSAFQVQRLRVRGSLRNMTDLQSLVTPWHCLVCCEGFGGTDLPTRAIRYIDRVIVRTDTREIDENPEGAIVSEFGPDGFGGYRDQYSTIELTTAPDYVQGILRGEPSSVPTDLATVVTVEDRL